MSWAWAATTTNSSLAAAAAADKILFTFQQCRVSNKFLVNCLRSPRPITSRNKSVMILMMRPDGTGWYAMAWDGMGWDVITITMTYIANRNPTVKRCARLTEMCQRQQKYICMYLCTYECMYVQLSRTHSAPNCCCCCCGDSYCCWLPLLLLLMIFFIVFSCVFFLFIYLFVTWHAHAPL